MPVIMYLTNGVPQGDGQGRQLCDPSRDAGQQLVYKHAVSTIVPERDIDIRFEDQHWREIPVLALIKDEERSNRR
jgi:hypothetical protein